jgi:hypothetical protein
MANVVGCTCGQTHGNTGLPNCVQQIKKSLGLGITSTYASNGTANKIDLTDIAGSDFGGMLIDADRSKRVYPITELRNVTTPDEAEQYATDSAGGKVEVREMVYKMAAEVWEVSPAYVGKLKQGKCNQNSTWLFNADGVVGLKKGTDLYPIKIKAYAPNYKAATDADPSKLMVSFDYAQETKIEELWLVSWADLGLDYSDVKGLIDVNFNTINTPVDGGTNTTVSYALYSDYGFGNPLTQNVDGLVTANFVCTNKTTGLAVSLVSVVETADVKYLFTMPSQTTADVVEIKINTSTGFEGSVTFVQPA